MKRLTLILSMMIALIGFNANAAMYIVGDNPFGGWNPGNGVEMTLENGVYTYTTAINGTVYFVFADGLDSDWGTFNNNYRYGPANGNQAVTAETWVPAQKAGDHGAYYFSGDGSDYVFIFDETNHQFKVEGYMPPPPAFETFTVAGEPAAVFGEEWNPALETNDMTLDETDGLYKLVKEGVQINAASTIYYKVVANHSWTNNWGKTPNGDNQDYYFEEGGTYNLTFIFDLENETVSLEPEKVTDGPVVDDYYIVAGTKNLFGTNWNAGDTTNLMTEGEEGMFTWTKEGFEATAETVVEFKVVANSNWNTCWPQSDENGDNNWWYQFNEDGVYTVVITFNEETKEINLTATRTGDLPEPPQPTVDPVYIFGDVNNFAWDPTQGVSMTYADGIYTAEVTTTPREGQEVAYIEFTKKLAEAESETPWDDIAAFRFGPMCSGDNWVMTEELLNVDCELDLEGPSHSIAIPEGTWTVTVDLANGLFKINGEWPTDTITPEPEETNVYIIGDVNNIGWSATEGVQMTYNEENKVYTAEITTQNQGDLGVAYFGFTKMLADSTAEDAWAAIAPYRFGPVSDGAFVMTEELLGVDCALATDGSYNSIALPEGTWTVTVDLENNTFSIAGEWPETPGPEPYTGDVYILGEVNDNGGWFPNVGVKMTRDEENNVYTATIITTGEAFVDSTGVGYSYFSFTKQLADSANAWDEIAPYRFGAVSEGDFLVTDEQLNKELSLTTTNYQAFMIPAGTWNLTLSVDEMTLIINKADVWEMGDVNHDKKVDVSDVTLLINYVLNGATNGFYETEANCNGDDKIDVSDVTALIARVLAGAW